MQKDCGGLKVLYYHLFKKEEATIEDFLENREDMNNYCFFNMFYPNINPEFINLAIQELREEPLMKLKHADQDISDKFFSDFEFLFYDGFQFFYGYHKTEKVFYQLYHGRTLNTLVKMECKTLDELFTKLATELGNWDLSWMDVEIIEMDKHLESTLGENLEFKDVFHGYPYLFENENDFDGRVHSSATAGLYHYESGLMLDDKPFSFELMAGVTKEKEVNLDWFYEIVYEVKRCELSIVEGFYMTNPITLKQLNPHMEAVVFIHPVVWDEVELFELEHKTVGWLMAFPILKKELKILQEKGVHELMLYVQKQKINPFDIYRKPKFSLFG